MIVCGIDPGLSGALFLLNPSEPGASSAFDMPTLALSRGGKNKRDIDAHALAALLSDHRIQHAFVELVGAMPGQGVTGMFAFGKAYGVVLGILAALRVPYTSISPRRWKAALGVPADKDGARSRGSQLLPACAPLWPLKKHDGRAEAALLALYGSREIAGNRIELPQPRAARLEPVDRVTEARLL